MIVINIFTLPLGRWYEHIPPPQDNGCHWSDLIIVMELVDSRSCVYTILSHRCFCGVALVSHRCYIVGLGEVGANQHVERSS